jgi:hypothetical protein
MRSSAKWIVLLIAMGHFVLGYVFLQLGLVLTGFETPLGIPGRIGAAMFLLAAGMAFPIGWLPILHVPTVGDLPL